MNEIRKNELRIIHETLRAQSVRYLTDCPGPWWDPLQSYSRNGHLELGLPPSPFARGSGYDFAYACPTIFAEYVFSKNTSRPCGLVFDYRP